MSCWSCTFAERLPYLVKPHARRTCRLAEAQERVGVALGGEAGARLLHGITPAWNTSSSTVGFICGEMRPRRSRSCNG